MALQVIAQHVQELGGASPNVNFASFVPQGKRRNASQGQSRRGAVRHRLRNRPCPLIQKASLNTQPRCAKTVLELSALDLAAGQADLGQDGVTEHQLIALGRVRADDDIGVDQLRIGHWPLPSSGARAAEV